MGEFQELRITAKFTDEASGQLGALKRTFNELGGVELTNKFEGLAKQLLNVESGLKNLATSFATGGPSMAMLSNFAKGIGPIGLAAFAVYETLKTTIGALRRQATDLLNMAAMARRVGESTAQYIRTMEEWQRSNVSIERATLWRSPRASLAAEITAFTGGCGRRMRARTTSASKASRAVPESPSA